MENALASRAPTPSTRPLTLTDAVVPKENLLGEIGKGHKIAFNILNVGRFKLGAGMTGGAKLAIKSAVEYGRTRTAFGKPITDFGLIREKLAEMSIRAYVAEAMVYRTAGMIDRNLVGVGIDDSAEALKRIEEYDVECSMVKVWCPKMVDYVVDETVQIFGGAGYEEDYPAERYCATPASTDLRGHQRDQPAAGAGAADPPGHEGQAAGVPEILMDASS